MDRQGTTLWRLLTEQERRPSTVELRRRFLGEGGGFEPVASRMVTLVVEPEAGDPAGVHPKRVAVSIGEDGIVVLEALQG